MMTALSSAVRRQPRSLDLSRWGRRVPVLLLIGILAYLVVVPLVRLQLLAFQDGGRGYTEAYSTPGVGRSIQLTVGLALGSLAIAMVLGTALAWAANMLPTRLRMLRMLPLLPIVVPGIASVLGWSFLLSPRPGYLNALLRKLPWWDHLDSGPINIYSMPWIIIVTGLALTSFVYLFVSSAFENLEGELIDAARTCSSDRRAFFKVTLPMVRPALIYGGAVALLIGLGQFTPPLLLGRSEGISVLTTDMYQAIAQEPANYAVASALGSPLLLFGVAIVVLQKVLLGDQTRFVTHGGKGVRATYRSSPFAAIAIILYSLLATVLPILALGVVALSGYWSGKIQPSTFTLNALNEVLGQSDIKDAIVTSIVVSLIAVLIALPIGFIAANVLVRRRSGRFTTGTLDLIVALPLCIPAVVFGVGFLLTYTSGPFVLYGTRWVMILVYVTLMIPFATRMQLSSLISLGDGYIEASRVSGAGPIRTNLRILLPLMRSTLAGTAALIFILLANEFAASLLVRSATTQVMGTILFDYYNNGSYPLVACVALIMVLVTAGGVLLALLLGGKNALKSL